MLARRILNLSTNCTVKNYVLLPWLNPLRSEVHHRHSVCLHTFSILKAKLYVGKENQHAHNILLQSPLYNIFNEPDLSVKNVSELKNIDDILSPQDSWTTADILNNFKLLTLYCKETGTSISDEKFDKFIDVFTDNCRKFDDDQLIECLKFIGILPETSSVTVRNFMELWSALDTECVDRIEKWPTDKTLLVCDYWYNLNLARKCEFVWMALRRIGRKIRKLTPQQLVHTMFFSNIVRKAVCDMFEFEVNLNKCIDNLSINEIGVMSMGFFKTQTPIRNPELIGKIYKRLMLELDTVEDITLVNILKVLRYSSKIPQAGLMTTLLDKICPQIDRISLLSCLHVSLLGCDIQQGHEKSLKLVVNRFLKDIDQTRLKDIERISFVLSLFDFHTENGTESKLCREMLVKLKNRVEEIVRYPRCFPNCLHYLTLTGHYDEEFISSALDEKFIQHTYGSNVILGREIFCLDSFVRRNLKGKYTGHLLSDKRRKTMGKCLTNYIPERNSKYKLNVTDRILLEIKETCDSIYRHCHFKHVLPHFQRPDIIINYNREKDQCVPLSKLCPQDYTGEILSRDALLDENLPNIETIVIVVGGWNNFIRDTNKPTGIFKMKLTQLELLGHKSIVIPWFEWRLLENISERNKYIRRKLSPLMCN